MNVKKTLLICCIIIAAVMSLGCTEKIAKKNPIQEKYGDDADYFIGLQELQIKDNKNALRHFNSASVKGSKYVKRRSLEQKIKLGNIKQQIEGAKEYLTIYNDDTGLIFACKIFFENQEYSLLINATNSIDISKCPNELVKMRILALNEKQDSRLNQTVCQWFVSRKITNDHISFFFENISEIMNIPLEEFNSENNKTEEMPETENVFFTNENKSNQEFVQALSKVIKFRFFVSNKNYSKAFELIPEIQNLCSEKKIIPFTSQIVIDLGKTFLNASRKYQDNATYFLELSNSSFALNNSFKYYALIYAGRIYDKSGVYISKAENAFIQAKEFATTDEEYDMAIWFLLNTNLSVSTERCIESIEKYCTTWKNPYYFQDILDNLSLLLFTSAKWQSFPKLYKMLDGNADNATTSKFAYITGQLIKRKMLNGTEEEQIAAFTKAFELNAGTDIYYRLLAAKQLGLESQKIEKELFSPATALSALNDGDAEKLLLGYADFGFVDLIYPEWLYFYSQDKNIFGIEAICHICDFVRSCATETNNHYYNSLYMISKTANLDNSRVNKKVFELSYPHNFAKEVKASAQEFEVEEYDMLGLIRTESFFNPIVQSHAGALGLTQLMRTTFDDCAKTLKLENPDITDPATNIRLGTYYYSSLVKRLDNSDILALFAYNAGITRVRRWLQSSKVGLGIYKELPSDLFLETIPIAETRNYGRKVIQSAAIYAWLYFEKNPCDIIDEMM